MLHDRRAKRGNHLPPLPAGVQRLSLHAWRGRNMSLLLAADMPPPNNNERMQWQKEKDQLQKELAAAQQMVEMQKKGMAETVGHHP